MAILQFQTVVIFVVFSLNKNRNSSYIIYNKLLKVSFPMAWYGSEALFKYPFEILGDKPKDAHFRPTTLKTNTERILRYGITYYGIF